MVLWRQLAAAHPQPAGASAPPLPCPPCVQEAHDKAALVVKLEAELQALRDAAGAASPAGTAGTAGTAAASPHLDVFGPKLEGKEVR